MCTAVTTLSSALMVWERWSKGPPADEFCLWFSVGVVMGALGFGACYAALPIGERAAADRRHKRRRAPHWLAPVYLLLYWVVVFGNWRGYPGPLMEPAWIGFSVAALFGYPWYRQRWLAAKRAYLQLADDAAPAETPAAASQS